MRDVVGRAVLLDPHVIQLSIPYKKSYYLAADQSVTIPIFIMCFRYNTLDKLYYLKKEYIEI